MSPPNYAPSAETPKGGAAPTMPVRNNGPVEDDEEARRMSGISLTRPFPRIVKASHVLGWILVAAGSAEVVVGALIFNDWKYAGGFWVGFMAFAAGVAGTCVSITEHSGGFPTAAFFFQSAMCLVAATLSLVLVDGLVYSKVHSTEGNCVETSSCLECGGYDCVCWEPDGSTDCFDGTSTRKCLHYQGGSCDDIEDSESLLAASTFLHIIIMALVAIAMLVTSATCCCCKYTVLLRREDGVTRVHRL
ncbi:unnamed protein product [Ectocarpus sp. 12 AP-2014]